MLGKNEIQASCINQDQTKPDVVTRITGNLLLCMVSKELVSCWQFSESKQNVRNVIKVKVIAVMHDSTCMQCLETNKWWVGACIIYN